MANPPAETATLRRPKNRRKRSTARETRFWAVSGAMPSAAPTSVRGFCSKNRGTIAFRSFSATQIHVPLDQRRKGRLRVSQGVLPQERHVVQVSHSPISGHRWLKSDTLFCRHRRRTRGYCPEGASQRGMERPVPIGRQGKVRQLGGQSEARARSWPGSKSGQRSCQLAVKVESEMTSIGSPDVCCPPGGF